MKKMKLVQLLVWLFILQPICAILLVTMLFFCLIPCVFALPSAFYLAFTKGGRFYRLKYPKFVAWNLLPFMLSHRFFVRVAITPLDKLFKTESGKNKEMEYFKQSIVNSL